MFNALSVLGQVMKAFAENAVQDVIELVADPIVKQQLQVGTSSAINNLNVPAIIGQVSDNILPHATIQWTPDQLNAGVVAYTTSTQIADVGLHSTFEAGAIWARNLAASSIVEGVNTANGFTPDLVKLALDAAAGALSGGPAGAILAAASDAPVIVGDIRADFDKKASS